MLKLSGQGQSELKFSENGNECKTLPPTPAVAKGSSDPGAGAYTRSLLSST
jgi:hypothetical protein